MSYSAIGLKLAFSLSSSAIGLKWPLTCVLFSDWFGKEREALEHVSGQLRLLGLQSATHQPWARTIIVLDP